MSDMQCQLISFCALDPSAQAAWVQAIGSVLAIFVAVYVGWHSAKSSRDLVASERDRQSTILASTLSMRIHSLGIECTKKVALARQVLNEIQSGVRTQISAEQLKSLFLLTQHSPVIELQPHFLVLDKDSGILVNLVIDMALAYNPSTSVTIDAGALKEDPRARVIEILTGVISDLSDIGELCDQADEQLETNHGLRSKREADV